VEEAIFDNCNMEEKCSTIFDSCNIESKFSTIFAAI